MDEVLVERMLEVVRAVPAGTVVTYGDVAARAGSASARLAGWVMSNLSDESVPWHRVVRADGRMAPHLAARQGARLAAEGVLTVGGRVDLSRFRHRDRGWNGNPRTPDG